jgi:ubiquinone/menaquinone biosynthesis C-methylase UbiE
VTRNIDHFSAVAEAYAESRPHYPDELFRHLGALSPGHDLAWDCAAGSGQASLPLARAFKRVIATDLSRTMLARAPSHPALLYAVSWGECSAVRSASVDLVTVAQGLHWLQVDSFYREVNRVLLPEGVLAVWTYGKQDLDQPEMDWVLASFYRDTVGPYWAPERRHVESGYRTLPFPYPELVPPTFVMQQRWSLEQLLGYVGTWSATQRFREDTRRDPIPALREALANRWGDPESRRLIRWPLSLRVGRRPA